MYSTGEAHKLPVLTSSQPCLRFSLEEIQSATKNFDNEQLLGQGGFAKVYKGDMCFEETSHVVAIKRLNSVTEQGELEFRSEIEVISKLRHCNLVSLIGFCDDNKELILVYAYMPHGTLYHHLHEADTNFKWVQRLKIAIGAAHGLNYLHKGADTKHGIIHRDVKSSNILLDENWAAMISDFGLSKLVPVDHSISTSVKGTFGYMDPEYFYTRKLTWRTDVYAFGVVLLELLSGRLAVDGKRREEECSLVRWAQKCMKERKLDQMVDPKIRGTISSKCLRRFAELADRCLLSDVKERPTMTEVVASLEDLLQLQNKWDNSANSSNTTGFTWKIHKYLLSSTKDNHDQRPNCSTTNPENNIDRGSSTNKKTVVRDLKMFTLDELRCATRGFAEDQYLGVWSFGEVYKGWVHLTAYSKSEEVPVVIKPLCWNKTAKLEKAELEVDILKEFSHPNLVKLIGYCWLDNQLFLVNEVMANGNFEDHLFSGAIARLPLVTKVKIAVGIARGIVFLHNAWDYVTTYFQIGGTSMFRLDRRKILLDEDFTAKLSDCELTKLADGHYPYNIRDDSGHSSEPFQLQSNLDGFTLVLMEVLTGKPISHENEVQKMDDFLLQHGKMSISHNAKLCFEICNEVDSESMMLTLFEEYQMYIYEATTTAESCLNDLELKPVGTLEVKLVQARGLTNKHIIGKSNPFAELYIHPLRNRMETSKVIKNDLNPIWNEYFEFVVEDVSTQQLTVKIYDHEWLQAAELLGCAQVQLSQLEPGKVKEVWIKLLKDLDLWRDTKDRGKVHLELLYCPYGMESGFKNPFTSNYTMTSLEKVLKSGDTENSDLGNKQGTTIRGLLSVTVISAEDLPPTDLSGKANPFVVLTMKKTRMKYKTRVVNENLNPVWNQTFDFIVEDGLHDMLVVEVYDHDTFGKDYMGRCVLTLTRVILEGEYKDCFPLEGAKLGKLNVNLKWMAQPIYRDS